MYKRQGEVLFKADLGAVGGGVAQVQGVWVAPKIRGRGLAAPAMATVTNTVVRSGRTASLYVHDFNTPAIATYRRCGYTDRGTFTTVLYSSAPARTPGLQSAYALSLHPP